MKWAIPGRPRLVFFWTVVVALALALSPGAFAAGNGGCVVWNDGVSAEQKLHLQELQSIRDLLFHSRTGFTREKLAEMTDPQLLAQHLNHLGESNRPALLEGIRRARENSYRPELTYKGPLPKELPTSLFDDLSTEEKLKGRKRIWVEADGHVRMVELSTDGSTWRMSDSFGILAKEVGSDGRPSLGVFYFQKETSGGSGDDVVLGRAHFRTPLELFHVPIEFRMMPGTAERAIQIRDGALSSQAPAVKAGGALPNRVGPSRPVGANEFAAVPKDKVQIARIQIAPARPNPMVSKRQVEAIFRDVSPKKREIDEYMQSSVPVWVSGNRANFLIYTNGKGRSIARAKGELFPNVWVGDLPRGRSYNYIILPDGTMDFGLRTNAAELGVKHVQLAEGREVVSAGEIHIDEWGRVQFNNESGSYAKDLGRQMGYQNLEEKTRQAFRAQGVEPQSGMPKIKAEALTPGQLRELCLVSLFLERNSHLCVMAH